MVLRTSCDIGTTFKAQAGWRSIFDSRAARLLKSKCTLIDFPSPAEPVRNGSLADVRAHPLNVLLWPEAARLLRGGGSGIADVPHGL